MAPNCILIQHGMICIVKHKKTSKMCTVQCHYNPLLWHHNGRDGISNHQPHDCLLNRSFGCRSKKTSKLRVTGLCARNSPVTGEFPTQMASNAENVFIWWRHHASQLSPNHHNRHPIVHPWWRDMECVLALNCDFCSFSVTLYYNYKHYHVIYQYSELPNTSGGTYTSVGWHIVSKFIMCRPEQKCRVAHCLKINISTGWKNCTW